MNAQISLKKIDQGMYDDLYELWIEAHNQTKFRVKINEFEFNGLIERFPFIVTQHTERVIGEVITAY